jgi:hypothetical protein
VRPREPSRGARAWPCESRERPRSLSNEARPRPVSAPPPHGAGSTSAAEGRAPAW